MAMKLQKRISSWLPARLRPVSRDLLERVLVGWRHIRFFGRRRYCPVCGNYASSFLPYGVISRPQARCPFCGAMERHRLVWLFFQRKTQLFSQPRKKMLHIAPEAAYQTLLSQCTAVDYLTSDHEPGRAMEEMDITDISYDDDSFDVIYCSHVLEHVVDDRKAMRELRRVLKSGGWAVLQVPIYPEPTFEDATIVDPAERERVFGQWDHVRRYGPDYCQRLEEAGFDVRIYQTEEFADESEIDAMALWKGQNIYFCKKPAHGRSDVGATVD